MRKSVAARAIAATLAVSFGLIGCGGSPATSAASSAATSSASSATSVTSATSTTTTSSTSSSTSETTSTSSATSVVEDAGKTDYDQAVKLYDEGKFYSAKQAFEKSQYGDWEERAAACVQTMPETGIMWQDENAMSDEMGLEFDVGGAEDNVGHYFKVYTSDHAHVATAFVKGTDSVELWMPGGNYYIKDAIGTEWYGDQELFGAEGTYEDMVFDEFEDDRYLTALDAGYEWTIGIGNGGEGQGVDSEQVSWGDFS